MRSNPSSALLALATRALSQANATNSTTVPHADVTMFGYENCVDLVGWDQHETGPDTYCTVPRRDTRSIQVQGYGFITTTWSGTNCRGSSYVIPDSACHNVQFGSVSLVPV